jgi:AcrR family transcriptional regulator
MAGRPSKKTDTRLKILEAAQQCVARFGFEKTTLEDIAKEIGLNKATLYYYYANKEEIFLEITGEATRQFLTELHAQINAAPLDSVVRIRLFLLLRATFYLKLADSVKMSAETMSKVEHLFWEQTRDVALEEVKILTDLVEQARSEGKTQVADCERLANQLIAFSEGIKASAKLNHVSLEDRLAFIESELAFMGIWLFR